MNNPKIIATTSIHTTKVPARTPKREAKAIMLYGLIVLEEEKSNGTRKKKEAVTETAERGCGLSKKK